jgi:hypothetical protein
MTELEETVEQKLARDATVIDLQMQEIDRLRAQVTALTEGTDDAHSTLRRLYLDETQSSNARIRAATAALNVEKPSLKPQPPALELTAKPVEDLATLVRRRRARQDALQDLPLEDPRRLEWIERDGNGSDDNTES